MNTFKIETGKKRFGGYVSSGLAFLLFYLLLDLKEMKRLEGEWNSVEFEIRKGLAIVPRYPRELRVFSILALLGRLGSEMRERRKERAGLKRSVL